MEAKENIPSRYTSLGKRFIKVSGVLLVSILLLLALIFFTIQIPSVQQKLKNSAVSWLSKKIGTEVTIEKLDLIYPNNIGLYNVFFEDSKNDTLIQGGYLGIDLNFWALIKGDFEIDEIWLKDIKVRIVSDTAGVSNYQHIMDAFSSGTKKDAIKDTAKPIYIDLKSLKLNNVNFIYEDSSIGLSGNFYIHQLRSKGDKFNLDNQEFGFSYLNWNGGDIVLNMWDTKKPKLEQDRKDTVTIQMPKFIFNGAGITEVLFSYQNPDDGMAMVADIGIFDGENIKIDLYEQTVDLGTTTLRNISYTFESTPVPPSPPSLNPSPNWIITAKDISLLNSNFQYDDMGSPRIKRGMDYAHLNFSRINLAGKNLYVSGGDTVSASISSGNLNEKSGLRVNEFKGDLLYTDKGISLKNLLLTTPFSRMEDEIEVGYESASLAAENPGDLWLNATFKRTRLSHRDLLTAAPLLYDYPMFANIPNATMDLNGKVFGQLKDLTLQDLSFRGFGNTTVRASGRLTGLPDPYNISTNLTITEFTTTDKDIRLLIPEGIIPDYVTLPAKLSAKGNLTGSVSGLLKMDLAISSSMGGAFIKGYIEKADNPDLAKYNLQGELKNFELGKLTGQPDLGMITANFKAVGSSYQPEKLTGQYNLYIDEVKYQDNIYKDISLRANADKGVVEGDLISAEQGQEFNVSYQANLNGDKPALSSYVNLISIDLQKFGYSEVPFSISAEAELDFPKLDPEHPQGYFLITNIKASYDTTVLALDSIYGFASYNGKDQFVFLRTDFARVEMKGAFSVAALFPEIINFINLYYIVAKPAPALRGDQQVDIQASFFPSEKLSLILPDLQFTQTANFSLELDTKLCIFDLKGDLPALNYGDQGILGATVFAEANDTAIAYKIFVNDYYYSNIYEIPTLLFQGDIVQRNFYTDIRLLDNFGRLQHTFAGKITQVDSGYSVHIDPSSVLLNYDSWKLDPFNELFFSSLGIFASNFTFSNGTQALIMQTFGEQLNDPLGIRLFNFKISTVTGFARQDSLYLDGTINGFAELILNREHFSFTADLDVDDLTYKNDTIGDIVFNVENSQPDIFNIKASVGGFDNDISVAGDYNSASGIFDIQLDIERLGLQTIQPFTLGYLNRMSGHIEGGISISGTADKPLVIGNMLFRDAEANVPLLNSLFSLKDERIRFMRDGIHFNNFTLTDQTNKTAILNGAIKTKNWLSFQYELDFEADDFRVINSTRRDNKLFYGTLLLDTKISFRGTDERPVINSYFKANNGTNLTMVMPQIDPEIAEKAGVVEFFDVDKPNPDSIFALRVDSLNTSNITGISLNANFEIDPNARLAFVIDEANGDMLVAKGKANLTSSIDPSGKISLSGTYELVEGSYEMSISFAKYRFAIESGSTIIWTGEPTQADINVTALYSARTAPFDLVENMILGETAETQARFRDRLSFNVKLIIRGELLKPDISFDIEIAETSGSSAEVVNTVNSRLEQLRLEEAEMNKQVFALILLGTFVPDNPFGTSSGGANASSFARQSVSKLLASQLNQIAGSLISGVDIDIGIDSDQDYSTGSGQIRTDLNLALSKRLLKDRLRITVGSNFELEGAARPNEKTSNIAGDIKADYLLTRSGQYILRAFRIDQYEVALQGQVVETGVTFIINMDFDKFKELFEKKRKGNSKSL